MRVACVLVLAAIAPMTAGSAITAAATSARPRLGTVTQTITMTTGDSRSLQILGATAAWPIDGVVVTASAQNGTVHLQAHSSGRTKVIVVAMTRESTLEVVVQPGRNRLTTQEAKRETGTAELRYSSAARELQSAVSMRREEEDGSTEALVRTTHHLEEPLGDQARTSITTASLRFFRHGRELTLLDREVSTSPLMLYATPIRGIHYVDPHWRLHAGFTAFATYQSFIVPVEREMVGSAGYAFRTSPRSTITPSLLTIGGEGSVLSLLYDFQDGERLAFSAEAGVSGGLGGATRVRFNGERDRLRADIRYRPPGFAVAGYAPRGLLSDASWTRTYGRSSTLSALASATSVGSIRSHAAALDIDHRLTDVVTLVAGASWGRFGAADSLIVPAGLRLDFARGGVGALYRYARSNANEGGHGLRLSLRTSLGRVYLSAYADRQENAPTLSAIFSERPDLALALEELGITATSPADVAAALREHAELIDLGFIEGVTVELAPVRTQLGFETSWNGSSAARHQFRLRLLHNDTESVATRSRTTIATLTYARRFASSTDIFAGYSWWRGERDGRITVDEPFIELGIRQAFDGLPSLGGSGTISGVVFADENLDGQSDGTAVAAELNLDGVRTLRTKADGTFAFRNVKRGSHRVVARVPERPEAYFTTPSKVDAEPGERVSFGIATMPARLHGRLTSDTGDGLAGVRVLASRGDRQVAATTGTDGRFELVTTPGEWRVAIVSDSVPAGYSLLEAEERTVMLDRIQPARLSWQLPVNRSVRITGLAPDAEIEVQPLQKRARADSAGNLAVRSLPAGELTIVAGSVRRTVVLPATPGSVTVDFGATQLADDKPELLVEMHGERRDTLRWVVQIGAFRLRSNALNVLNRARQTGVGARLAKSGPLTIVRAGPFDSRAVADETAQRLERDGIEAVVTPDR